MYIWANSNVAARSSFLVFCVCGKKETLFHTPRSIEMHMYFISLSHIFHYPLSITIVGEQKVKSCQPPQLWSTEATDPFHQNQIKQNQVKHIKKEGKKKSREKQREKKASIDG